MITYLNLLAVSVTAGTDLTQNSSVWQLS